MKNAIILLLTACFLVISAMPAIGFSTHNTTIFRSFDKEQAVVDEPITITVSFINLEVNYLRGLYYTVQIPRGLSISTINVRIAGNNVSHTVASGICGEIYENYTPYRWILELPPSFAANNPVSQDSIVDIVHTVTSSSAGVFCLNEFNWVGFYQNAPIGMRPAFGYSQNEDQQTIRFYSNADDLARDHDAEWSDLEFFANNFGKSKNCDQGEVCEGEFELDGDVDGSDLAIFANQFSGTNCIVLNGNSGRNR